MYQDKLAMVYSDIVVKMYLSYFQFMSLLSLLDD